MRSTEFSGERLGAIIAAQGRRQDWLADAADVHRTLLWKYVTGRARMTRRTATRLAAALGIELDELRTTPETPTPIDANELVGVAD